MVHLFPSKEPWVKPRGWSSSTPPHTPVMILREEILISALVLPSLYPWGPHSRFQEQVSGAVSHALYLFHCRKVEELQFQVEEESIKNGDKQIKLYRCRQGHRMTSSHPEALLPAPFCPEIRNCQGEAQAVHAPLGPEIWEYFHFLLMVRAEPNLRFGF